MKNEKKMPREEEKKRKEERMIERKEKGWKGCHVLYCITFQRKWGIECEHVSISELKWESF